MAEHVLVPPCDEFIRHAFDRYLVLELADVSSVQEEQHVYGEYLEPDEHGTNGRIPQCLRRNRRHGNGTGEEDGCR
ncbi:hypothetical protein D3C84_878020 [compost metagenome]